jgi:hypothetical protein
MRSCPRRRGSPRCRSPSCSAQPLLRPAPIENLGPRHGAGHLGINPATLDLDPPVTLLGARNLSIPDLTPARTGEYSCTCRLSEAAHFAHIQPWARLAPTPACTRSHPAAKPVSSLLPAASLTWPPSMAHAVLAWGPSPAATQRTVSRLHTSKLVPDGIIPPGVPYTHGSMQRRTHSHQAETLISTHSLTFPPCSTKRSQYRCDYAE